MMMHRDRATMQTACAQMKLHTKLSVEHPVRCANPGISLDFVLAAARCGANRVAKWPTNENGIEKNERTCLRKPRDFNCLSDGRFFTVRGSVAFPILFALGVRKPMDFSPIV